MEPTSLWAGFECSTHRRPDGVRLDLVEATEHADHATNDYAAIASFGFATARDGARWHLIEPQRGCRDWSSLSRQFDAARAAGVRVAWDLCHYGWPDWLDIWSDEFVPSFADYAAAFAERLGTASGAQDIYCPINEISYFAWAGGEVGRMGPFGVGHGAVLKRRLVEAFIAACRAIRSVDAKARFICAEPLIHVAPPADAIFGDSAISHDAAQFEAVDMILGRRDPDLGGRDDYLTCVGLNFYPDNQWYFGGSTIPMGHHAYCPLSDLLVKVYERYGKTLLITETGAEGRARPYWLHHIVEEVISAGSRGVPVAGICLYPVLDYPGWDNGRHCSVGLMSLPDGYGRRSVYQPLLDEMNRAAVRLSEHGSASLQSLGSVYA